MRWEEIRELKFNPPESKKPISDLINKPKHLKPIGSGWQTMAYELSKHPDKVVKISNIKGKEDPIYQFVRLAKNHQDNPYFPKILFAKLYPAIKQDELDRDDMMQDIDPNNWTPMQRDMVLLYVTEKLYPFSTIQPDELNQFIQTIGLPTNEMETLSRYLRNKQNLQHLIRTSSDNNLKKALRLMAPLINAFWTDLHTGNIMLRKGNNGTQVVFVDPFSDNITDNKR